MTVATVAAATAVTYPDISKYKSRISFEEYLKQFNEPKRPKPIYDRSFDKTKKSPTPTPSVIPPIN